MGWRPVTALRRSQRWEAGGRSSIGIGPILPFLGRGVIGDFDGDRKTDFGIYRARIGLWLIKPSSGEAPFAVNWGGQPGDKPVPGDCDGDGITDMAVYNKINASQLLPLVGYCDQPAPFASNNQSLTERLHSWR